MYNLKKRFAKDMSIDIIIIIEENEKLKERVKILEEDNKLLTDQVSILKELIEKNNITITHPLSPSVKNIKKETSQEYEYKNNSNEINILPVLEIQEKNKTVNLNNNSKEELIPEKVRNDDVTLYKTININKNNNNNTHESTEIPYKDKGGKNRNRKKDKSLSILDRYIITVYDDIGNSIIKQLIAKETELIICYKNDIADKIKKNIDNITIDDVMDYIAKHDKLSYAKKSSMKYLFERCEYLYKQYAQYNKLDKFKFDVPSLAYMSRKDWSEWIVELDKLVKIHYSEENICQHIMANNSKRPREICGKIDCKKHNIK
jgi:hypothetical protein